MYFVSLIYISGPEEVLCGKPQANIEKMGVTGESAREVGSKEKR